MKRLLFSYHFICLFIAFASAQDFKQLKREDYPKRHVRSYQAGDSIKKALIGSGIDTVILLHKTRRFAMNPLPDNTDNHRWSFLLWLKNNKLYFQRVNDFAIYEPIKLEAPYYYPYFIFDYYFKFKKNINEDLFQCNSRYTTAHILDSTYLVIMSRDHSDLTILDYKIGSDSIVKVWSDVASINYADNTLFVEDMDKRLYTWILCLEKEYYFALMHKKWQPLNLRFRSQEEWNKIMKEAKTEFKDTKKRRRAKE